MSRKQPRRRGGRTSGKRTDVGFGRPPVDHQFKPGQSGNKRGRPKGSKSEATILDGILGRKLNITQNGKTRKITVLEAIYMKAADDALKGDQKAATFILNRRLALNSSDEATTATFDVDDQKLLEFYGKEIEAKFKKQGDDT